MSDSRLFRWPLAFVWLATGLAVLHPEYRRLGAASLEPLGLPDGVMWATCAAEVALGLRVALGRAALWLTLLQAVLIVGFTAILSVSQPELWVHPFGPLTKNVPVLALVAAAWWADRRGNSTEAKP